MVYGTIERFLSRRTELFLFESAFARNAYEAIVGRPRGVVRVVFNGISTAEMTPVTPNPDAADIVSVGEFRHIKGTDVLFDAVAELHRSGQRVTLAVAGDGEEGPALRDQVARLGLTDSVRFLGRPARIRCPMSPSKPAALESQLLPVGWVAFLRSWIRMESWCRRSSPGPWPRPSPPHLMIRPAPKPELRASATASGGCSHKTPWSRAYWPATARRSARNSKVTFTERH
jgi:glycosyltransferase involved in cell wall biosynthesis